MNLSKCLYVCVLLYGTLFIAYPSLNGQELSFDANPIVKLDSLQAFDNYTVEEGLPNNTIYDIIEDKYGYIWIATGLGLSRFDGTAFKNYYHDPLDSTSISADKITCLVEDSEGYLWIGTNNGLNKYIRTEEHFQRYYQDKFKSDGLPGNHIRAMLADTLGIIWLETGNGFFSHFDTQQGVFENYSHEVPELRYPSHTIKKLKNGNIVILGRRITPKEFNVKTQQLELLDNISTLEYHYFISSFYEKENGELLFHNSASYSFATDATLTTHQRIEKLSSIYENIEDRKGMLWMGGYKSGAIRYDMSNNELTYYRNDPQRKESIVSDLIFKIYEDKSGDLWFATNGGLSKLKSNQFIRHIKSDSYSDKITAIVPTEDAKQLWIATSDQGLLKYNLLTNQYEENITTPKLLANQIQDIHLDTAGQLWIAQWRGKGFNILDTKTGEIDSKRICTNSAYDWWSDILETRDKKIYLSTWGMGPFQINRNSNDILPDKWLATYRKNRSALPILISNGNLFFTDKSDLILRDLQTKKDLVIRRSYKEDYPCSFRDKQYVSYSATSPNWTISGYMWHAKSIGNKIWVTTSNNGLYHIDTSDLNAVYSSLNALQDTIIDIAISENSYLLGPSSVIKVASNEAVLREFSLPHKVKAIEGSSLQVFNKNILVTSAKYLQYYEQATEEWKVLDFNDKPETIKVGIERTDYIWLITDSKIYKINKKEFEPIEVKLKEQQFSISNISSIAIESNEAFWIGTDNGLFLVNLTANSIQPYFNSPTDTLSLPSDKILSLRLENNKDIWVGTQNGIAQFNRTTKQFVRYNYNSNDGLSSRLTASMYEDSGRNIWVGNTDGSLDRLDVKNKTFSHFFKEPWNPNSLKPDNGNTINCIYEDTKGRIWIGGGSLSLFNENLQNFTHYNDSSYNPFNSVKSIVEDDAGNLWIGTNRGLYVFDPIRKRFQHYGIEDNIQGQEFSKASCKLPDGRIIVGGNNGFNIIEPSKSTTTTKEPVIHLFNFKAGDDFVKEELVGEESIELTHHQNTIHLSVSLGSYQETNAYQYRLSDYEKDWTTNATGKGLIEFENLPPGDYELAIIADNISDGEAQNIRKVHLHIAKPFWNTGWFFACTFIPFAILISLLARRQQKKIIDRKEKDLQLEFMKIKASLSNMNPHFIFNVLGSIQNQVLEGNKEEASNSIVKVSKLIRSFLDSTAGMTLPSKKGDSAAIGELLLSEEIKLLSMYLEFEELQHQDRFVYELDIEEGLITSNYSIPPMLLQPFVENAIKHGLLPKKTKGTLTISFERICEEGIEVRIMDDGVGIEHARKKRSMDTQRHKPRGLALLHERVANLNQLGYDIGIETSNRKEGGTLVILKINRSYDNY